MANTAADILLDTICDWGVDVIFGLPGDGINGLMEALRKRADQIRFIQVRHEESAAFMACAYAKYTGKLGVCLATSGPGGIHLLNGLYDAKLDRQPVLAITGHHFHDLIDTHAQQDVNLDRLFADVAVYNTRVMGASHVANVADLACRTALSYRGVAHINFPVDLQEQSGGERSKRNAETGKWTANSLPSDWASWRAQWEYSHAARFVLHLSGIVSFSPVNEAVTRVSLRIDYEPETFLEEAGDKLGVVSNRVQGDLQRFKEFIEARGTETGAWRGEI